MADKVIKIPGPDHPIIIETGEAHIRILVDGKVIADTEAALVVREASYPPVYYIPRDDADLTLLERSDHSTYCPYKGDASYFSIPAGGSRSLNAIWSYENPYPAVAQMKGYLAFYPDRVDAIEEKQSRKK